MTRGEPGNPIADYIARLADEPETRGAELFASGVERAASLLEMCAKDPVWVAAARHLPTDQVVLHLVRYLREAPVWPDKPVEAAPVAFAPPPHPRERPWPGGFASVVMRGFFHRNTRSIASAESVGGPG